jgi:FtsP/CotA-like multicopper oxidase with cupredoxin domain
MRAHTILPIAASLGLVTLVASPAAHAEVSPQCPGDLDGDAVPDPLLPGGAPNPDFDPKVRCVHLAAGDGYVTMADGRVLYMFGFSDVTGVPSDMVMDMGMVGANFPAPTIAVDEGDQLYISLTNVGMAVRSDLFDPHSVHFHGFPNAATVFDGEPEASVATNMGATFTYFYNIVEPGTYMYHCHVEATEHMQMGMLGNLYVRPAQDKLPAGSDLRGFTHQAGFRYAYDDGDGSTRYDVEVALQLGSFDPYFHDQEEQIQPPPFYVMADRYFMLNGRGYPDTVSPLALPGPVENGGRSSQPVSSSITAHRGQRILLRLSNLNVTRFNTLGTAGIPLQIVGRNARLYRGPSPDGGVTPGHDLYYRTTSVTLGGGESFDAIIDTSVLEPGTYFLYSKSLNELSNDQQDLGGMMTEIVIQP